MLREKLTEEEAWLWFILQSPALSAEFFWSDDSGNALRLWHFQWEFFDNDYQREFSFCARYVSKSWCAAARAFTFPFRCPGETMFITAAEGMHLDTLLAKFDYEVEDSYIHRNFMKRVIHKPFYKRICANGSKIFARVPQRTGKGVKSIHAKEVIVDEFQDFTPKAKSELVEVYKAAARRFIAGVPEVKSDPFVRRMLRGAEYKIWRFPRMKNPDWNDLLRQEKIAEYGGEDSAEYRRNVYGEPVEEYKSIFKKRVLYSLVETNSQSEINKIYENEVYREEQTPADLINFVPIDSKKYPALYMGIDLGWVESPTVIVVVGLKENKFHILKIYSFYRYEEPDKLSILKKALITFDPIVVGIDSTAGGVGIYQNLKNFRPDIYGLDVRKKITVGDREVYWNDFAVELVVKKVENREVVFPFDEDLLKDWASASFEESGGRRIYSKGIHSLDAFKALLAALWDSTESPKRSLELEKVESKIINLPL